MNPTDLIEAVPESEAAGEIADIFADLRSTLEVPFVNLIWRHLATIPHALPWIWKAVKPLYLSAGLATAIGELRSDIRLPVDSAIPGCAWDAADVDANARVAIAGLLDEYNRANAKNLLGLLVAQAMLNEETSSADPSATVAASRQSPEKVAHAANTQAIRLPAMSELPASVQTLIRELDRFGRTQPSDAVGSLYRHLGHWPGFLAMVYAALFDAYRTGRLRAEHERTLTRSRALAKGLLRATESQQRAPLDATGNEKAMLALTTFTDLMIARMLVMGTAMRALLPDASLWTA